jgi:hypothetical protein
MFPWF